MVFAMDVSYKEDQCKTEVTTTERFREEIPAIVDELVLTCGLEDCFDPVSYTHLTLPTSDLV